MQRAPMSRDALRRLLLMYLLQQRQQQGGGAPKPNTDTLQDVQRAAKQGKDIYTLGKDLYKAGGSLWDSIFGNTASEATQQAWNKAAGEASQAAWNAGADAATKAQGATDATAGAADAGSNAGTLAAVMSVINSARRFTGTSRDEQQAYEASMAAPRALAAYYTLGGSELLEGFARKQWGGTMKKFDKVMSNPFLNPTMAASKLWTSDKWKKEGNRVKSLIDAGVDVPEPFRARMFQQRGLSKKELINPKYGLDFQGMTADGYVNNKFENSRNEADMTYETLAPYAVWAEKRNDWWKLSDAQRRAVTDAAQKAGAVREHHGTLDVDWNKVGDVDAIIKGVQPARQARPAKGQVARLSPGVYLNDRGNVIKSPDVRGAMQQSYGNRIPRRG